jgi:hypothetical protein
MDSLPLHPRSVHLSLSLRSASLSPSYRGLDHDVREVTSICRDTTVNRAELVFTQSSFPHRALSLPPFSAD